MPVQTLFAMSEQTIDLPQRLLTVQEYNAMIAAGILTEDDKVELLQGRIVAMSPAGSSHASPVNVMTRIIIKQLDDARHLRVQSPLEVETHSVPEPDLAIVAAMDDDYRGTHPTEQDALVVIEVAVSSQLKDRLVKAPLYAEAGVPEYWIVLPEQGAIEVYRRPLEGRYGEMHTYSGADLVTPGPAPEVAVRVSDVLGA